MLKFLSSKYLASSVSLLEIVPFILSRGPKSVTYQVVATLPRQLDLCTLVNRNLFANHYLKVPMFSVAHFSLRPVKKIF